MKCPRCQSEDTSVIYTMTPIRGLCHKCGFEGKAVVRGDHIDLEPDASIKLPRIHEWFGTHYGAVTNETISSNQADALKQAIDVKRAYNAPKVNSSGWQDYYFSQLYGLPYSIFRGQSVFGSLVKESQSPLKKIEIVFSEWVDKPRLWRGYLIVKNQEMLDQLIKDINDGSAGVSRPEEKSGAVETKEGQGQGQPGSIASPAQGEVRSGEDQASEGALDAVKEEGIGGWHIVPGSVEDV